MVPVPGRLTLPVAERIERDPLAKTRDDEGRWIGGGVTQWVAELTFAVLAHGAAREAVANR